MTSEAKTVTVGWTEVSDSFARTGFFNKNELHPDGVLRKLANLVRPYTTVIGLGTEGELTPIGSGTFVRRIDGQCGILTAGHVIGAIQAERNVLVLPAQDNEEVTWVRIEGEGMDSCGGRNLGPSGPDIGWMPLSGKEVEKMEALGTVFYNRAIERETFFGQVCRTGIVFGFVEAASRLCDKLVVAHAMFLGEPLRHAADEDGWDYGEYAITSDDPWIPRTHGGVSGGAVWRIDLLLDGQGKKAVILEGVVFAEGPELDRKLIAHGEESVRSILREG